MSIPRAPVSPARRGRFRAPPYRDPLPPGYRLCMRAGVGPATVFVGYHEVPPSRARP